MRNKVKYVVLFIFILVITAIIYIISRATSLKELKGSIEVWADESNYSYLKNVADEFTESNKKVNIVVNKKQDGEILSYLNTANIEEIVPSLITVNSRELRSLGAEEIEKINYSDLIIENYNKNFNLWRLNEIKTGKNYLGVPIQSNPQVMMIREDILNEYGYNSEDIRTWEELINISKDIKNKSQGSIDLFSYNHIKVQDLAKIMIYQGASIYEEEELVGLIKNNDLMGKRTSLCYIANKNNYKDIIEQNPEDALKVIMIPAISIGGNRAVSLDGDNLVVMKISSEKQELTNRFIAFAINNQDKMGEKLINNEPFFPSSKAFYNNAVVDTSFDKINNQKLWNIMINVSNRMPEIKDYYNLDEIIKNIE